MSLENLYLTVHSFLISHQLIAVLLLFALGLFLWKKPWRFVQFLCVIIIFLAGFYIVSQLVTATDEPTGKRYEMSPAEKEELLQLK